MSGKRSVCIIGAGTAGLCAAKNVAEHGMSPVVYEQSATIGGTWVYTDQTHADAYGNEVVSSIYEGLRANLPKEVMGFPDFLYPCDLDESYVGGTEVLDFLNSYARHFGLMQYVKVLHSVIRVRPTRDVWEVIVTDLQHDNTRTHYFDFVLVCNGHYTTPLYPDIADSRLFRGLQTHSHHFRRAEAFKDQDVLLVGGGPSGLDLAFHIHKTARSVLLSHHLTNAPDTRFMPNVTQKPDLLRFTANGAIFADNSSAEFSCVVYCTGYRYTFPFLSADCGVHVEDNHVQPLYKHCVNIQHPTMALIGLPFRVCPTQLFDLQLRFVLKYYTGQRSLPSRDEMLADTERDMEARRRRGLRKRDAHLLGKEQFAYFKDLADTAGVENVKPVVQNILRACSDCKYIYELETYRKSRYRIIDDNSFVKMN